MKIFKLLSLIQAMAACCVFAQPSELSVQLRTIEENLFSLEIQGSPGVHRIERSDELRADGWAALIPITSDTNLSVQPAGPSAFFRAQAAPAHDVTIFTNALEMLAAGRRYFRDDTFGSERFWGDSLQIHRALAGTNHGGVGPGVSPSTALAVGLKVDVDALPASLQEAIAGGNVDLEDPATTLALLELDSVVGVKGIFE